MKATNSTIVHSAALLALGSALTLGAAICGSTIAASAAPTEAAESARVCAMVSSAQLHSLYGKDMAVHPAVDLPQASGCDWGAVDGKGGLLTVRVIPARYFTAPKLAPNYTVLNGIGDRAYVIPELGGWRAGALKGAKAVVIQVNGGASKQTTAVTLLKALVRQI